jgi:hypothetical protein
VAIIRAKTRLSEREKEEQDKLKQELSRLDRAAAKASNSAGRIILRKKKKVDEKPKEFSEPAQRTGKA